jgi:predicted MFS family arabinose efflux permease
VTATEPIDLAAVDTTSGSKAAGPEISGGQPSYSVRRGWLAVTSVAIGSFAMVLSEFLPIGLLPSIASELKISVGTAGLMVVATAVVAAISAPVVTAALSRIDRRIVLWSLIALLVVADIVGATAANFELVLLARVLLGIGLGGFWAIGSAIAARLVHERSVIKATSFITSGISLATVVSLPLGALVASVASWRLAFVIGAALGILALLAQLALLPKIPSLGRIRYSALAGLLRIPRARVGLIVSILVLLAQFAAYTYVSPYLEQEAKASPTLVTLALLSFGVAGVIGNFAAGVTLARNVKGTLLVSKIVLGLAVIALPFLAHFTVGVFILLVIWGLVWGAVPLGLQTWMSQAAPGSSEGSMALFITVLQIGITGGSLIGGFLVNGAGIGTDFVVSGVLAIIAAVVLFALAPRRTRASIGLSRT